MRWILIFCSLAFLVEGADEWKYLGNGTAPSLKNYQAFSYQLSYYIFGGFESVSQIYTNLIWRYDYQTGWAAQAPVAPIITNSTVVGSYTNDTSALPDGRALAASSQSADGVTFWLYGGKNSNFLSDLWSFNIPTTVWTWHGGHYEDRHAPSQTGATTAGATPGRRSGASSWVDSNGHFWIFGGMMIPTDSETSYSYNDLWKYIPQQGWYLMHGDGSLNSGGQYTGSNLRPKSRYGSASWIDTAGNFYMYGGASIFLGATINDLWMWRHNNWTLLSQSEPTVYQAPNYIATGGNPGGRYRMAHCTFHDSFYLFSGDSDVNTNAAVHSDVWRWRWDNGSVLWEWISGPSTANPQQYIGVPMDTKTQLPYPRLNAAAAVLTNDIIMIFGGDLTVSYNNTQTSSQLWAYKTVNICDNNYCDDNNICTIDNCNPYNYSNPCSYVNNCSLPTTSSIATSSTSSTTSSTTTSSIASSTTSDTITTSVGSVTTGSTSSSSSSASSTSFEDTTSTATGVIISTTESDSITSGSVVQTTESILPTVSTGATDPSPVKSESNKSLSAGGIAGVVIASAVGFAACVVLAFWIIRKKRSKRDDSEYNNHPLTSIRSSLHTAIIRDIEIKERLGGGNFSDVYRGIWNGITEVALKKLKSVEQMKEFTDEATLLQSLNHPNVVRFLGIYESKEGDKYIVTELMTEGSLSSYLQQRKGQLSTQELINMALQAAAGMRYLETNKVIHRDLALRNLLVTSKENPIVKVGDLGLGRASDKDYYVSQGKSVAIKWSAPEVYGEGKSTPKSDSWSFGVVLWEIFSWGSLPYQGYSNPEVAEIIQKGYRMPAPLDMPLEVQKIMIQCWKEKPEDRPNFLDICNSLNSIAPTRPVSMKEENVQVDFYN